MTLETVPLTSITDIYQVAEELKAQLEVEANSDIAEEFPDTVERYTGDLFQIELNLRKTISECEIGRREQFLTLVDGKVAGMNVVRLVSDVPVGIPITSPNLSGYIARPWRGIGIATCVMRELLKTVDNNFNGIAHTTIRPENTPSLTLARNNGLIETGQFHNGRLVFAYSSE